MSKEKKFHFIEKFIDRMGITYQVNRVSKVVYLSGIPHVSFQVTAEHKNDIVYDVLYTYSYRISKNDVLFYDSNINVPPSKGIFGFIGMDDVVDVYFENIVRGEAKDFFEHQFSQY